MPIVARFYDPKFDNTVAVMETDNSVCMVDRSGRPSNSQLLNSTEIHTSFSLSTMVSKATGQPLLRSSVLTIGPDNLPALLVPWLASESSTRRLRILIGGLGLGGVPEQLLRLYSNIDVTTVELNKAVIKCYNWFCKNYEFVRPIQRGAGQTVVLDDFFNYLATTARTICDPYYERCYYDMIFFDAYLGSDGESTNHRIDDSRFLQSLLKVPTRLLIFNQFLSDRQKDQPPWTRLLRGLKARYRVYEVKFADQSGIICVCKKQGPTELTASKLWPKNPSVPLHSNLDTLIKRLPQAAVKEW